MATHSSVLAWRIPGMVEPGGLLSMGSHRVGHDWSNLAATAAAATTIGLQLARLPCPLPSPGVCSNSCPSSQWCHSNISSSVALFSSCFQSFQASGSFPISWSFTSRGQSIGASASASVLPMNIQGWFPLGLTCLIQETLKSLLQHHSSKASILPHSAFFIVQLSHPYMTTGKTIALISRTFVGNVSAF